jgi:hypothetical protein
VLGASVRSGAGRACIHAGAEWCIDRPRLGGNTDLR